MTESFSIGLQITDLSAVRGYRTLFEGVNFSLSPGALLELRGANGSGKSTLLRMLAGLTQPAAGAIEWRNASAQEDHRHFLGHLDAIKPQESARAQANFWANFFGVAEPKKAARAALKRVGLGQRMDVPGRGLSAGQRRRLALTRVVMAPRAVWLLDEPLAALDVDGQALVRELIEAHRACGGVVIAAMHGDGFSNVETLDINAFTPRKARPQNEAA